MRERIRSEADRTFTICVNSYEQSVMVGRFYSLGQEQEAETFRSLPQLLNGIEQKLNAANYPQPFTAMRTFAPIQETPLSPETDQQSGLKGTFVVKILFRQHTSWQGTVTWLEGRGEQTFRSALELIFLMDSALNGNQVEKAS